MSRRAISYPLRRLFSTESPFKKSIDLKRPVSPFAIYKPQMHWLMSIGNRITGVAIGALVYGYSVYYVWNGAPKIDQTANYIHQRLPKSFVTFSKFLIAMTFNFHTFCGIRHLIWDAGYQLTIRGVYLTGYLANGATVVSSLAMAAI
ncbi:cytochrome b560 subunit of succinate dehydrogenase [Rozella allomycis CSF55]|uniref:Cytochrome b560 subunit of succinate dehydrogenase n=1 Tax=Rozella allomycis (strain CSF55) TaxID=988480 RepID=A0A075AZ22_ROZAC|nr:Succinate dehydrogenase, cytochrome b subunit domain-containing protein [Rozella allomycis CSF55]RKP20654.1 cytochrome b560 subunit of succinate dehydrogenase [Rozella allomycis CSF55]|eukprot:EPZ33809.1 Succinate dehydrogenase, cytochrome b subunit domain-containing protein [Rozella allomycis CSF55]